MLRLLESAVRKGASGTNANQNQPDPERAPADSKPRDWIKDPDPNTNEDGFGLGICGGALGVWLVLVCVGSVCPLPNCALNLVVCLGLLFFSGCMYSVGFLFR